MLGGCDLGHDLVSWWNAEEAPPFGAPDGATVSFERHVLDRLTWGARPGDVERVTALGGETWIERQLDPAAIDDARCDRALASIESLWVDRAELYERNESELRLDLARAKLIRAHRSERQLFEVMVDFWSDHFNIAANKSDCRWMKAADDHEVIRTHAFGTFRDLVRASATSPAMLVSLDGRANMVRAAGDAPNENYARELMELHTLGVHGGYTQRDVQEVARCLSGWTYDHRPLRFRGSRVDFDPARHDDGAKHVLGTVIPAGGGAEDLERVLDLVCAHPSTARTIATKLSQRFIDHDPDPRAIRAVSDAFTAAGGAIVPTLRAVFATDAFRSARRTLFKRPFRYLASALRAMDAASYAPPALVDRLERMGHAPFQYPTPDGYPMEPAPWYGTMLWRWNVATECAANRLRGVRVDVDDLVRRAGGVAPLMAHLLGREPTELERTLATDAPRGVVLALAAPAFQYH